MDTKDYFIAALIIFICWLMFMVFGIVDSYNNAITECNKCLKEKAKGQYPFIRGLDYEPNGTKAMDSKTD